MKINAQDVLNMVDKKSNKEEIYLDINHLKNTISKINKELSQTKEDQGYINEALCSENCVARWIWKKGVVESTNGMVNSVKWDMQSVNTCPDNFIWKDGLSYVQIDSAGLYEITLAFFSKKKKPLVQVLANNEVIA